MVAISGDSKNEGFLLATVEKKQSYLLESLANEGIFSKVFPDPVGVNPFFVTAQVYSPGEGEGFYLGHGRQKENFRNGSLQSVKILHKK